jgi:hypothetical protein
MYTSFTGGLRIAGNALELDIVLKFAKKYNNIPRIPHKYARTFLAQTKEAVTSLAISFIKFFVSEMTRSTYFIRKKLMGIHFVYSKITTFSKVAVFPMVGFLTRS